MYTQQQRQTVMNYANWLAETKWDTFSTITYRYDVKTEAELSKVMTGLEEYLKTLTNLLICFGLLSSLTTTITLITTSY